MTYRYSPSFVDNTAYGNQRDRLLWLHWPPSFAPMESRPLHRPRSQFWEVAQVKPTPLVSAASAAIARVYVFMDHNYRARMA